jgi:hypothetical protein
MEQIRSPVRDVSKVLECGFHILCHRNGEIRKIVVIVLEPSE